jgi:hypothetical protein
MYLSGRTINPNLNRDQTKKLLILNKYNKNLKNIKNKMKSNWDCGIVIFNFSE